MSDTDKRAGLGGEHPPSMKPNVTLQRVAHGNETGYAIVIGGDWVTISGTQGRALEAYATSLPEPQRSVFLRGLFSALVATNKSDAA